MVRIEKNYVLSLHCHNYRSPGLVQKLVSESLKLNFLSRGTCCLMARVIGYPRLDLEYSEWSQGRTCYRYLRGR